MSGGDSPRGCFVCAMTGLSKRTKLADVRKLDHATLVSLLNSDVERHRNAALLRVVEITKAADSRSLELADVGVIPVLVQLLADEDVPLHVKAYVAAALCNLSQEPATHPIFASGDIIKDIVNYVVPSHQVLSGACAIMLGNLMSSPILERQMLQYGAPAALVKGLVSCTEFEICCAMIDALATLATKQALRAELIIAMGIEVAVYVLHNLARSHFCSVNPTVPSSHEPGTSQSSMGSSEQPVFSMKSMKDPLVWSPRSLDSEGYNNQMDASALDSCSSDDITPTKVGYMLMPNSTPIQPDLQDIWGRVEHTCTGRKWSASGDTFPEFRSAEVGRVEKLMNLLYALVVNSEDASRRLVTLETGVEVITYWIKRGTPLVRHAGLRIIRQLLHSGQGAFTSRRDVVEAVAPALGEDMVGLEELGINANVYRRNAVQAIFELCLHGGDAMRIAGGTVGIVVSLLRILDSAPPSRMQHAVLRALHNLCQHNLPKSQLATSGGIPSLLELLAMGMRDTKWSPRQMYDSPVSHAQQIYHGASSSGHSRGFQHDSAYHVRALEYCSALLRQLADAQSPEWTDDLLGGDIVPTMLEAVEQTTSFIVKKQALGSLTSLVSYRHSSAPEVIAAKGGSLALMSLRFHGYRHMDDSHQWKAWSSLALYHLLGNKRTRRSVMDAARGFLGEDARGVTPSMLRQVLRPSANNVDVEWIVTL